MTTLLLPLSIILLTIAVGALITYTWSLERRISRLEAAISEANHIHCPPSARTKIVENGKVSCIFSNLYPANVGRSIPYNGYGNLGDPIHRKHK